MTAGPRFVECVSRIDIPLAETFLAFALEAYPDLDVARSLENLDALGRLVRPRLDERDAPEAKLQALSAFLRDEGFRGDRDDYYDPRNSFLNEVLERRLGLPITLSVVWIETARRAGLPLVGIGMPMHFLVRLEGGGALADPFNGGRLLRVDEAVALFGELTGGRIPWRDEYLDQSPPREIVRRALVNLKAVYGSRGDMRDALWVEDHLLAIPGAPVEERRERATVHTALGRYPDAIADLRAYLESGPEDAPAVESEIRRLVAAMN